MELVEMELKLFVLYTYTMCTCTMASRVKGMVRVRFAGPMIYNYPNNYTV